MAFTVPNKGRFAWRVLAQGLKTSPSTFQRFMDTLLAKFSAWGIQSYIDDILIGGNTEDECKERIQCILDHLRTNRLTVNADKSTLLPTTSIEALGHIVAHNSVTPSNNYVSKILDYPRPETKVGLRKFQGLLSHIHVLYPSLQHQRALLYTLLQKSKPERLHWTGLFSDAFERIKFLLKSPTPLGYFDPDVSIPVDLFTDAGENGYGAILQQEGRIIGTISRKYHIKSIIGPTSTPGAKEAYALKEALKYFLPRTLGRQITAYTDNQALTSLVVKDTIQNPYLARIIDELREYSDGLTVRWISRDDPRIQIVDQMGR
jgi:hypothetical protein